MNVLYVEDNQQLRKLIHQHLSDSYNVDTAETCYQALKLTDSIDYDLIIIDYFLPDHNGDFLCEQIRKFNHESLILFLSHNHQKENMIKALETGADDYLTKPFYLPELQVRIRALIRRRFTTKNFILKAGNLCLNLKSLSATYNNIPIPLKRKEILLLEYLMLNKGNVVSRNQLYEHVWSQNYYYSNTVDVHIRRLRSKIETPFKAKFIRTVYGLGYQLTDPK